MFSWITGPRITNAIEELQPESNYESTFIEPPETPAHQFAVNAFKHAIFGTPAPQDANEASKKEKKAKLDLANAKAPEFTAPKEEAPPLSPSKQPGGILMTPGTANKGRKTVSFGSQVVDNEGKRGNIGKSGIPNDCPGKFPSPWTPGTQLKLDPASDKRPRTKLTEALLDARTTTQQKSGEKPKARDDSDITIDLGAPRSESGKYWKEQYECYAERSEKEMKKVIAKQQLAKKFAMKKDGEVTELATKLEQERKRFRQRERELEQQNKDYQERLRQALEEKTSASVEVAALKARVATLEKLIATPSTDFPQTKGPFHIYEDVGKETIQPLTEQGMEANVDPLTKENATPKPRRHRRQNIPDASTIPEAPSRLGTSGGEVSIILGKSPRAIGQLTETASRPTPAANPSELPPKSPLRILRTDPSKENAVPNSPVAVLPSSPLPMPSPGLCDPWLDLQDNSIPQIDKMAIPGFSGQPFTRPAWNPPPRKHRQSKSVSTAGQAEPSAKLGRQDGDLALDTKKAELPKHRTRSKDRPARSTDAETNTGVPKIEHQTHFEKPRAEAPTMSESHVQQPALDSRFDVSKITSHHAEGSSQVKRDRVELPPVDRKEQARQRVAERSRLRKNIPA